MTYNYYELLDYEGNSVHGRAKNPAELPPITGDDNSWWRPGEILVHEEAGADLEELLKSVNAQRLSPESRSWRNGKQRRVDPELNARLRAATGFELFTTDPDADLPQLVERSRGTLGRRDKGLTVNSVLFGEGYYMGGPGAPVAPADQPEPLPATEAAKGDRPIILSVLDTGMPFDWAQRSYRLQGVIADGDVNPQTEMDLLDTDGNGYLDTQAAHGLFICGLANRHAPEIRIDPGLVLHPFGDGDEVDIIDGMVRAQGAVLNMSLGGYSPDAEPTEAMANAVAKLLDAGTVIVAAAGNGYRDPAKRELKFFPAAIKGVIAVGAYDSRSGQPADFSNRGEWVDVWAPGVDLVSDFVTRWPVEEDGLREVFANAFPWLLRRRYRGWARWSGTSFAAPLVAAEIADRVRQDPGTAPQVIAQKFLESLADAPWPGIAGKIFDPGDYTT